MEVPGLSEKGSAKRGGGGWRTRKNRKSLGDRKITKTRRRRSKYRGAVRGRKRTSAKSRYSSLLGKAEAIRLGEEGRILPKPLRAHAPGGIVKNGIAGTDRHLIAAKHLPRESDPRLKCRPIPVDARRVTDTILTGNQKLARAAILRDVICHAVIDF